MLTCTLSSESILSTLMKGQKQGTSIIIVVTSYVLDKQTLIIILYLMKYSLFNLFSIQYFKTDGKIKDIPIIFF